jgi:DNA-binding transcriptional LysR family regulator
MDRFYNMQVFAKVVEMGSFTAVANHIDSTVGNVSRAISALETTLDTRLLHRTTRRLSVTEAGKRYYERCTSILADLEHAEAEARDALVEPRGLLRVHAVPGLGRSQVTRAVLAYREAWPNVSVDLLLSQRMPNLLEEQLDLSIVIARALPDSAYVGQKIASTYCILAASPDYLEQHPAPESPDDLAGHACVLLTTADVVPDEWLLHSAEDDVMFRPSGPYLCVNDVDAMSVALQEGAGIGIISGYRAIKALRAGTLVRVLPRYHTSKRHVYAVYSSRQFIDARVKCFVDVLKTQLGAELSACLEELAVREPAVAS